MPTNRSRRSRETASARRSIEIELVFEAKIGLGGRALVELRPEVALDLEILEHGLDDEIRRSNEVEVVRRRHAGENRRSLVRGQLALRDRSIEIAGDPVAPRLRPREVGLVQRDGLPDRGVDLADAVAHEPGAGDEDVLDRHRAAG